MTTAQYASYQSQLSKVEIDLNKILGNSTVPTSGKPAPGTVVNAMGAVTTRSATDLAAAKAGTVLSANWAVSKSTCPVAAALAANALAGHPLQTLTGVHPAGAFLLLMLEYYTTFVLQCHCFLK